MELLTNDFNYDLPKDRIALYPAPKRELSKLLVFDGQKVHHKIFKDVVDIIPGDSLLVFNNSRVVPARIIFKNKTGATIEVFLQGPESKNPDYREFFNSQSPVRGQCTIGNKKRWSKHDTLKLTKRKVELQASLIDADKGIVEFSWQGIESWGEALQLMGDVPLPPYIKRETEGLDAERYQTVYSKEQGAVAAPTAGLHFTEEILESINRKGIKTDFITLHVGAGTFLPIKSDKVKEHTMHPEVLVFTRQNIETLLSHKGRIIPVGTTSCRSLESLYWFGCEIVNGVGPTFSIDQNLPYKRDNIKLSRHECLRAVAAFMDRNRLGKIWGSTSIFIYPSYHFKMTDALITNFHQPGSTLILLVAAMIGDNWKRVYQSALDNQYKFLSYGDSSLLFPRDD